MHLIEQEAETPDLTSTVRMVLLVLVMGRVVVLQALMRYSKDLC